jgi:murein L,D-transpeptidase YcbB/YkuD
MRQIKYFPDFCAVASTYQQRHGETLAAALDGDLDMESDWKKYVWLPLLDMINRSQAAGQSIGKAAGKADKIATAQGQALKAKQAAANKAKPIQLNQLDKNKVMLIQKKLGLPSDGIAGPATTQAVQKYLQQNKLASINQALTKLGIA